MSEIRCSKCKIFKNKSAFYKGRKSCIECKKKYEKEYRKKNLKKIKQYVKTYRERNKKIISERKREWYQENKENAKAKRKEWYLLNKDRKLEYEKQYIKDNKYKVNKRIREYQRDLKLKDPTFKIKKNIRNRLNQAVKNNQKAGSAVRDLGCSIDELKAHLEAKFESGMNWDNYGKWHIDHIRPLDCFDLTNREQFLDACHYTNLQPLWASDNIRKSNGQ